MAQQNTLVGARAVLFIDNQAAGIFESVSYNKSLGVEPIHTLGAYGPREISINSSEACTLNCGAFRVVGAGARVMGKYPTIGELMNFNSVTIAVVDRKTNKTILVAEGCVPNTESGQHNARAASRVTLSYTGTVAYDESVQGDGESAGSPTYP